MVRATFLTFFNEFRLLVKDRVGLFMLVLAPFVIIAVAGFSLGNIYGALSGAQGYTIPVVNQDGGAVGDAIVAALKREPSITVKLSPDLPAARGVVGARARTPLAIMIPAGTTAAFEAGDTARLELYVDPVKRLEVNATELRLAELCREITLHARAKAQQNLATLGADQRAQVERVVTQVNTLQASLVSYRREFADAQKKTQIALQAQIRKAIDDLTEQTRAALDRAVAENKANLTREMSARRDAQLAVADYLTALQSTERSFDQWFAKLKTAAGSHSGDIPSPPAFPPPPSATQLAELSRPLEMPSTDPPRLPNPPVLKLALPKLPSPPDLQLPSELGNGSSGAQPTLPGDVSWRELSLAGGSTEANAFDQYVPGFGITFLLIGMLMGVGLGLIDERDWGTLMRLRVSGAPLIGILIGKVSARFVVGLMQMILLFVLGWCMFGISLGRDPVVLLLPTAGICFAGAAFGLVIACVARTHDSVMPIGAVVAMAMSAIGGCWWPLDFEPSWMRGLAQWLPTTWTMQAYNDLMIRNFKVENILWSTAATFGLGIAYLIVGLVGALRLYE
jgi:ABC-type multidrug transport system permease subunit